MTSTFSSLAKVSNLDLLAKLAQAVQGERQATAQVIALLMEVEARKLYAQQSCSSLFIYCVQILHFSEHAAYLRIEAARAARRFPAILDRLAQGSLHLSAVSLVAPHLTADNHLEVLDAARHKSKRDVELLVAGLRPLPDVPAVVRKLPTPQAKGAITGAPSIPNKADSTTCVSATATGTASPPRQMEIKPLAPERFKVQFTVSRETCDKLRQVQDLLRHTIPDGDLAAIFDRALTLLLTELSKTKFAATDRPRARREGRCESRHIPSAIKREVWQRDGRQCAFRGEQGRCHETGFLEFHHVVPYARGGPTTTENLELRCRAHNVYEAEQQFGRRAPSLWARESRADYGVDPDGSVRTESMGDGGK